MNDVIHVRAVADPTASLNEIGIPCGKVVGKSSDPIGSRTIDDTRSQQDYLYGAFFSKLHQSPFGTNLGIVVFHGLSVGKWGLLRRSRTRGLTVNRRSA
jgi:hypothetical protein